VWDPALVFVVELNGLLDPVVVAAVGGEAAVEVDVDLDPGAVEAAAGERRPGGRMM
jgi:hypothetical protein